MLSSLPQIPQPEGLGLRFELRQSGSNVLAHEYCPPVLLISPNLSWVRVSVQQGNDYELNFYCTPDAAQRSYNIITMWASLWVIMPILQIWKLIPAHADVKGQGWDENSRFWLPN